MNALRVRRPGSELSARPGAKTPIRGTLLVCCACVASGRATAQPVTTLMKSRRLIAPPKARDKAPYQVELAMSALGQLRTLQVIRSPRQQWRAASVALRDRSPWRSLG